MTDHYKYQRPCDLNVCNEKLFNIYKENWKRQVRNIPKLRTYVMFKKAFESEYYLHRVINRGHRSVLSQFRCGILPLSIEVGRYTNTPLEDRVCELCENGVLEDECHFLLECEVYRDLRAQLLSKVITLAPEYCFLSNTEKLSLLLSDTHIKDTAKFLYEAYYRRRRCIYV